jgi:Asp-tRNA(Asn)/Glu-tRNA(Gln) amidotransferase A subunit family amidase
MSELVFESAASIARMIREKEVSPLEVVRAHIERIEAINPKINAFVATDFDRAIDRARALTESLMRGEPVGPLCGVPISIKDTIQVAGLRMVAGTRLRQSYVAERDAPVVSLLLRAGAIILGKTNVPEMAMDYRSENEVFGRTNNPWDMSCVPGGSSGGEAAAIASGCSAAGVGSDLGGSIRVPSHFCGIAGLKPTPGRISGSGHFPPNIGPFSLGASLGPMARRVEDLALMFKVLAAFDPSDASSIPIEPREPDPYAIRSARVMWYCEDGISPVTSDTKRAVELAAQALAERGFQVSEQLPAGLERAHELWYDWLGRTSVPGIISLYQGKEDQMGPLMRGLKRLAESQPPLTLDKYISTWFERDALKASVVKQMMEHPIILAPVAALPAFKHDHRGNFDIEGQQVDYLKAFSYAQAYNLLGLPSATVPCARSRDGLPIGVQVVGRPFEEERVLAVAAILEEALGGFKRPPL